MEATNIALQQLLRKLGQTCEDLPILPGTCTLIGLKTFIDLKNSPTNAFYGTRLRR